MISHVSKLVNYIRKSVLDTEIVFNAVGFRLPAKNATRWNSTYFMLSKFLQMIDKDSTLCSRLNAVKKHGNLTAFQIVVLKELVAILKPFVTASDDFQVNFETIGNVITAYIGLRNNLTLTIKNRNGTEMLNPTSKLAPIVKKTKSFVNALRESLERRFSPMLCDVNYVLGNHISNIISSNYFICFLSFPSGTILDPRFKKGWIKFSGYSEASVLESVKAEIQLRYRALRMF